MSTRWTIGAVNSSKPGCAVSRRHALDDFLRLSDREILHHAGRVSHDDAVAKAEFEYDRFAAARAALPALVEKHFEEAMRDVKQLEKERLAAQPEKAAKGHKKP